MTDLSLQEKSQEHLGTTSAARWWTSFALLGALLFAAGDLGLRLFYHPDPLESPYRSWIVSALADYPKMPPKPKIAIFGSSLVVATVNDGDATTLGQEIDGTTHHRSITLERALAGTAAQGPTTQSFAIGGQMASDAFAILNTLFNNSDPKIKSCFSLPATIVWGIAPRDLMDATFLDPYSSTTVSYLDKLTEKHDSLGTRKFYFWRYLEELADNCFYSYGQRDHFLVLQKQTMYSLLGILGLIRPEDMGTVKTPQELLRIARRELPEDNGLRQWMVKPQTQPISQFEDNSKEYTARYNPFKQKLFDTQMAYLDKFLALARQLGIKVLLVNMPLTRDNLALIPAGKYQLYLDSVRRAAAANDAAFIDYNDDKTFTREYFNDMVHLNGYGSRRFFQMVGDEIKRLNMPI